MTTLNQNIGGIPSKTEKLIISGPCSAETELQVHETVKRLAKTQKIDVIRAGIWKPRTRPNAFEGVGKVGLEWLVDAGKEMSLPVAVEVANAQHVNEALESGVDILWLGARTTVNPFSVQEIANALEGVNIPVMVKNPINPDLELWMGAIERLHLKGIENIIAIHRGFSSYQKSIYRNDPMWEIPIQLKLKLPEIPIICDPSHITGRRDLLSLVSQKAFDLDMSGLMIESHITPDEAWSDAAQQITPEVLNELLENLVLRNASASNLEQLGFLEKMRTQIDTLDEEIIQLFGKRMDVAKEIGRFKKENNITILQTERWKEIYNARKEMAEKLGLSVEFIEILLTTIHQESIKQQNKVMNLFKDL